MEVDLPYLMSDVDRHGNPRLYARKLGRPKVRLRTKPGTPEFLAEYHAALKEIDNPSPKAAAPVRTVAEHSFEWLVRLYEKSYDFAQLDERTRRVRSQILQSCLDEPVSDKNPLRFAECPVGRLDAKLIRLLRDRKKDAPGSAGTRLKSLRVLLSWAVENDHVKENVARDVKPLKYQSEGFHSWTREEIAQFEAAHPVGTKGRLALALLMFTGVRRSDVVLLGPKLVKDGLLVFAPEKTKKKTGKVLHLPILPPLQAILDASPLGSETYLETSRGEPFTSNGFGNWFRDRCNEANLPHCSAHGIRKAAADIVAENGATEKQMMAIFGWTSAQMAAHYSRKASQKKLAADSMHLMIPSGPSRATAPPTTEP